MALVTAPQRKLRFIPQQIVTHAEELAYLRGRLRASMASPALNIVSLHQLHERIEAHIQGLMVAGPDLLDMLAAWLEGDERDEVFAAACGLLRTRIPAFEVRVLDAFMAAGGARLTGIGDALGVVGSPHVDAALLGAVDRADALHAAHAALALANRRLIDAAHPRLASLLAEADTAIAVLAWRCVTLLDDAGSPQERPYNKAVRSEDATLREAALTAAAWHGEQWVLPALAQLAQREDMVGWRGLAAWGDERCVALMQTGLDAMIPPPQRAALAARWGHPSAIERTLEWMSEADPLMAASAGEAFSRMTGFEVEGRRESVPVAEDADVFAREFAEDVWLPDVAKARMFAEQHAARWDSGTRWCSGFDISAAIPSLAQTQISMQARWDFGVRAALAGTRVLQPPPA